MILFETLLTLDDNVKHFSYSINDGSGLVSKVNVDSYIDIIEVFEVTADNTSYVS